MAVLEQCMEMTDLGSDKRFFIQEIIQESEQDGLAEMYEKRDHLEDEIRLLENSIRFFEDIVDLGPACGSEVTQFRIRLAKVKRQKKALELAITCWHI